MAYTATGSKASSRSNFNKKPSAKGSISSKSLGKSYSTRYANEPLDTLIIVPPDGGWGWVIVCCAFFMAFITDGIAYAFGLFIDEIALTLKCTKGQISIASSILTATFYMCGPIVSALVNRFGFRVVSLGGILIGAIGFAGSSFVPNYGYMYFTYGVLGGTGLSMMFTSSTLIVGFYFQKWRALATGIASCGTALGLMALPPIISNFMSPNMDYRTVFQIFAAMIITCIIPAAMYTPLRPVRVVSAALPEKNQVYWEEDDLSSEQSLSPFTRVFDALNNATFPTTSDLHDTSTITLVRPKKHTDYGTPFESKATSANPSRIPSKASVASKGKKPLPRLSVVSTYDDGKRLGTLHEDDINQNNCCLRSCDCCRCCILGCLKCATKCRSECCKMKKVEITVSRPMYRDDIFYQHSLARLPEYQKTQTTEKPKSTKHVQYTMSVTRVATQRDLDDNPNACCPESVTRILITMLDFRLLKQLSFSLILISGFLTCLGLPIPYTFIIDRAKVESEMSPRLGAYLLTALGTLNIIGRFLNGAVSCVPKIDPFVVSYVSLMVAGASVIASVHLKGQLMNFVFAAVFGLGVACVCIRAVLIADLVGLDKLTNAFGIMMLCHGIGSLVSAVGGVLVDITNGYEATFYLSGVSLFVSGLILIPIPYVRKWEIQRDND